MTLSLFEKYPPVKNSADIWQPIPLSPTKADSCNKVKQNGEKFLLFPTFKFIKEKITRSYSSSKYCLPDVSDAFINLMAAKELL